MCGRFTLSLDPLSLKQSFPNLLGDIPELYRPSYNIAPTQNILVLGAGDGTPKMMRWGMIPFFWNQSRPPSGSFNARDDKLFESPMWRESFRKKRCLIPADGFYEWRKEGKTRIPMRIALKTRRPFAFAGLWDEWKSPNSGNIIQSCTIITTAPNNAIANIHTRMPVILSSTDYASWLAPTNENPLVLMEFIGPYPSDEIDIYKVSQSVGDARNNIPQLIDPL